MAEMTPQDIVKNCDELKGSGQDWKQVYVKLLASTKANTHRIFRTGNTLFWVHIVSPGVGQAFAFNADPKDQLVANVLEFLAALKAAKYKTVSTVIPTTAIFTRLQKEGYAVDIERRRTAAGPIKFKGTIHV